VTAALVALNSRTFSSLRRHRNYRLYFVGQIVSLSGTWMQNIALSWLIVELTHSPVAVGLLAFVRFCAAHGYVSEADLASVEECVDAERDEFVAAALDPDRRRLARAVLEQMLKAGLDPRDPAAPPAAADAAAPVKERKTSRRLRKK